MTASVPPPSNFDFDFDFDFDFAVAGGGPAGSSAAIVLAQRGHRVVLFEPECFPRFHIGESLLSTVNDALDQLGLRAKVEAAGFPIKWGARLLTHDGSAGRSVDFAAARGIARPRTWQVRREDFDTILLDRAREVGVEVRQPVRVTGCEFSEDAVVVSAQSPDGETTIVRARALVDATGQHGLLSRKFGLRRPEPLLANIALYSHYHGVPRLDGKRPTDLRLIAREDAGWFWTIPVSDDLTSVGLVVPRDLLRRMPGRTGEERFDAAVAANPVLAELMRGAHRTRPVRTEKDFSYRASAYAGDRWVLVGDAGSFLDPVFSTGVSTAMESGIEAAQALDAAADRDDFSAGALRGFSRLQQRRYEFFRRYVVGFYTPEFRDRFFAPRPPEWIFRSVVTALAGNWKPDLRTRFFGEVFFASVALQKRVPLGRTRFRRDAAAGYPVSPLG